MAYEASQRLLVGFAYNHARGRWDLDSKSSEQNAKDTQFLNYQQWNGLSGENATLGLLWRWPTWSLGISHRMPFHMDYTFTTLVQSSIGPSGTPGRPTTRLGLHWPPTTGIGYAYRPSELWLITADLKHTLWSQARFMSNQHAMDGQSFFDLDRSPRTPNATSLNMGVERLLIQASGLVVPLRAGLFREPQPLRDRITGDQRIIYGASLGTGFKRGALTMDFGYSYSWSRRHASQFLDLDQLLNRNATSSLGTERTQQHRLDCSFIYQFDREPVRRVLNWLFVGDRP